MKKLSKTVKFTSNEEKTLSTKKPHSINPNLPKGTLNTSQFQSSFSNAAANKKPLPQFLENPFACSFTNTIRSKGSLDPRRQALNDTTISMNEPPSHIEMFKNSNFSLIEFMKKNNNSENILNQKFESLKPTSSSQISTPRLTPLKMLERNRANVVSKDDINKLEDKIKDLEDQIFNAKKKGEESKLDKLEKNLKRTEYSYLEEHL